MQNLIDTLKSGGTILYPTDTIWGIGCDATNIEAINKIFEIKKREVSKSLIIFYNELHFCRKSYKILRC